MASLKDLEKNIVALNDRVVVYKNDLYVYDDSGIGFSLNPAVASTVMDYCLYSGQFYTANRIADVLVNIDVSPITN